MRHSDYSGACLTRLPVVIPFLHHNVAKKFSLKEKLCLNQPLKSRKSYLSSEENCPSSVWEAADLLHIHSPPIQTGCRRHCVSGMCHTQCVHSTCPRKHLSCPRVLQPELNSLTWAHFCSSAQTS